MPFNEQTVQRIREIMQQKNADFYEKKMFSGLVFMVDDKMCCGTHTDKKTGEDVLLCRVGETESAKALLNENAIPMDFTGTKMKDFIYVLENGFVSNRDLAQWIQKCLNFNPTAKASKRRLK